VSELGKELKANELMERTVVVVGREDRAAMYTTWVSRIGVDFVAFYSGVSKMIFVVKRNADDTMSDDTGKRIHVFEFLGEV
jgi:hypothetical protein